MSDFDKELELMSEEEVEATINTLRKEVDLAAESDLEKVDIEKAFNLMKAYKAVGEVEGSSNIFYSLKPIVNQFRIAKIDEDAAIDFVAEWNFEAMRYTDESNNEFICMPFYEEIFDVINEASPKFRIREIKCKLQLVHHYRYWVAQGGDPEKLEATQKEFLEHALEQYIPEIKVLAEQKKTEENWDELVDINKSLYKFYQHSLKANETIAHIKLVIEDLPKSSDFHPADIADLQHELGTLFHQHKKYKTAVKYFGLAGENYGKLGEEFEPFKLKSESWLEESKGLLA